MMPLQQLGFLQWLFLKLQLFEFGLELLLFAQDLENLLLFCLQPAFPFYLNAADKLAVADV
jgi:hypothetical protein